MGGAIEEASRSSKVIDERVIISLRDKNTVIVRFRNKMMFFYFLLTKCLDKSCFVILCHDMYDKNVANLFYPLPIFSIDSNSVLAITILFY